MRRVRAAARGRAGRCWLVGGVPGGGPGPSQTSDPRPQAPAGALPWPEACRRGRGKLPGTFHPLAQRNSPERSIRARAGRWGLAARGEQRRWLCSWRILDRLRAPAFIRQLPLRQQAIVLLQSRSDAGFLNLHALHKLCRSRSVHALACCAAFATAASRYWLPCSSLSPFPQDPSALRS